jgi:hypothetical protein
MANILVYALHQRSGGGQALPQYPLPCLQEQVI